MNKLRIIIALLWICAPVLLFGQRKLPSDTFRVIKDFQPVLIDAEKIPQEAIIDDTMKLETELEYKLMDRKLPVSFSPELISPATIKGEPLIRLYNGYARVGVGNALLPFAELYYGNLRSRKYAMGTHLKYFSMPEVNQIEGSEMSRLNAQVHGKRFWKRNTLSSELNYGLHQFNYYGYYNIPNLSGNELGATDLEQQYNRFEASAELTSTKKDSFNLRHQVSADYSLISNQGGMQEHYFAADAVLSKFNNAELFQLDAGVDYNLYDDLVENGIFYLKPNITSFGNRFRVKAGLAMYMNASEIDNASFHFYPLAEVHYNVLEDVLIPYAKLEGQIIRNNYFRFTQENPFLAENILIANSNQKYSASIGMRGSLSPTVSFDVNLNRMETDGAPFYLKVPDNDLLISHQFYVAYDKLISNTLKTEIAYHGEKVKAFLKATYNDYETDQLERAWHRPELQSSLTFQYNLYDKLMVGIDLIYWSEQYAPNYRLDTTAAVTNQIVDQIETLEAIFDINLSFEYRYTKRLSAFVKFNNLGGLNYEKYQDYPVQGFNVWGGFTYSF